MSTLPQEYPRCISPDRHILVPVPWERALTIRERLLEWGIKSIARFDPGDRKAKLEVLHDIDPRGLKALLKSFPK